MFEVAGLEALAALQQQWEAAPNVVQQQMYLAMLESQMLVEREVKEIAPVGPNHLLRNSIAADTPVVFPDGVIGVVATSLDYAPAVELGTKPYMPPIAPLVEWVEETLGLEDKEATRAAWAIAMKTKKAGRPGKFMFRDGLATAKPYIEQRFEQCAKIIADTIGGGHE